MLLNYIELSEKADEEFGLGRIKEARNLLKKGLSLAKKKEEMSYISLAFFKIIGLASTL